MKILLIGSGGREHVLAWKLAQSEMVRHIYVAPGNAGTQWPGRGGLAVCENVPIPVSNLLKLRQFARDKSIDLTVVGPEAPLAEGIVDLFQKANLPIFGPTQEAAQLEASKAFSKSFMQHFGIPTADYKSFTDYHEAMAFLASSEFANGVVVKASGLAAGKGVIVCDSKEIAQLALKNIMQDRAFGAAGDMVILEERLTGPELSVLAFCDGHTVAPMLPARDHKRVFNEAKGPNTGGMGAYTPVNEATPELVEEVTKKILQVAVSGMETRGTPFVGILYAGLMLTPTGIKVIEFNCRFGDPEAQVILPLLENDLAAVMMACVDGRLYSQPVTFKPGSCATVVMASKGYPGHYPTGLPITGLEEANAQPGVSVFHAGTETKAGQVVTAGGRVLTVSAVGSTRDEALDRAYAGVEKIHFDGAHYRTDIGRAKVPG